MRRKIISMLLALTLIIGLVPVFASAAEDEAVQKATLKILVEWYNNDGDRTAITGNEADDLTKGLTLKDKSGTVYPVGEPIEVTVNGKFSDLLQQSDVNNYSDVPGDFRCVSVSNIEFKSANGKYEATVKFNRGGSRDLTIKKYWCCDKHAESDTVTFVITGPGYGYQTGNTITLNKSSNTGSDDTGTYWTYKDYPESDGSISAYGKYTVVEQTMTPPANCTYIAMAWKGTANNPTGLTFPFAHSDTKDAALKANSKWTDMSTDICSAEVDISPKGNCSTVCFANVCIAPSDPPEDKPIGNITKTASESTVKAGGTYYYTITVENTGTAVWENVVATDILPGNLTYVDSTHASDGVTVTDTSGTLTIQFGDIGIYETKSVRINVKVSDSAEADSTIRNVVTCGGLAASADITVVSKGTDPDPTSPLGTITKTASSSTVKAGNTYSYTITAKNSGTEVWKDVVATDTLPGELTYVGFTSTYDLTVTDDSGKLTINFGNIGISDEKSVTINVKVSSSAAAGSTIHNEVTAKSSNQDDVSDTADTVVVPDTAPSLTLTGTKNLSGRTLRAGEFSFTVADSQGNQVVTGTNSANGTITFSAINYTAAGTYNYTVSEVRGSLSSITYDRSTYTVAVTVTGNNGTLEISKVTVNGTTVTVTNGSLTSRTAIEFNNRYTSSSSGTTTTPSRSSSSSSSSSPSLPSTTITEVTVPTGSAPSESPLAEISDETVPLGDRPAPVGPQTGQDLPLKVLFVLFLLGTVVLTTTLIKGLRYSKKNN